MARTQEWACFGGEGGVGESGESGDTGCCTADVGKVCFVKMCKNRKQSRTSKVREDEDGSKYVRSS